MADWTTKYPVNFTPTGDTTSQAIEKHINEFSNVYDLLNRVRKFDAGTTAPADPIVGHAWLDTSVIPNRLKVWDGTQWVDILVGDADRLDSYDAGNASGQIPISNGTVCVDLVSDKVDGYDASTTPAASTIPVADANGFLNSWINQGSGSGLDADLIRGLPGDFSSSKTVAGYQKLPSGIIIQWFEGTAGANAYTTNNFPITFPNACLIVVAAYGAGAQSANSISLYNRTASSVDIMSVNDTNSKTVWVVAIGY